MAWLILILIVPLAGFVIFLFLGRTNLDEAGCAAARGGRGHPRGHRAAPGGDRRRTAHPGVDGDPQLPPARCRSRTATSRPLPRLSRRDQRDGRRGGDGHVDRRGRVLHRRLGRRDGPVFEALEAAVARGVKVRMLIDYMGSRSIPEYAEPEKRLTAVGIDWRPMLPVRPQGTVPAAGPAQPPQASSSSTGRSAFGVAEPHRAGLQQGQQPQGWAGVRRARRAHRRTRGQPARGLREGLVHRDLRDPGRGHRRGHARPPRRRCRRQILLSGPGHAPRTTCASTRP